MKKSGFLKKTLHIQTIDDELSFQNFPLCISMGRLNDFYQQRPFPITDGDSLGLLPISLTIMLVSFGLSAIAAIPAFLLVIGGNFVDFIMMASYPVGGIACVVTYCAISILIKNGFFSRLIKAIATGIAGVTTWVFYNHIMSVEDFLDLTFIDIIFLGGVLGAAFGVMIFFLFATFAERISSLTQ